MTKKLRKMNLTDQVCQEIKKNIISKEWDIGTKLPSEAELSEAYGVNRVTVRMALHKLNTLGILQTRAGDGTYVKEFNFKNYMSEISDIIIRSEMIDDVCAFRELFEIECSRLAIENADDTDIEKLEQACNNYEDIFSKVISSADAEDFNLVLDADLDFHYQICKSSKNTLFPLVFSAVREPIKQYLKAINLVKLKQLKEAAGSGNFRIDELLGRPTAHRIILDAIKKRDFKACKQSYIQMINFKETL